MVPSVVTCLLICLTSIALLCSTQTELQVLRFHRQQQPKVWWNYTENIVVKIITTRFITASYCGHQATSWTTWKIHEEQIKVKIFSKLLKQGSNFEICFSHRGLNTINFMKFSILRVVAFLIKAKRFYSRHLGYEKSSTVKDLFHAGNVFSFGFAGPIEYTLKLYLSEYLRLNATFEKMSFSCKNMFDCSLGHLSLGSFCRQRYKCQEYLYCGSLARFTNYYPRRQVHVTVFTKTYTWCNITFSFSIIDTETVSTVLPHQHSQKQLEWSLCIKLNESFIHKFHVHVAKCDRLVVELMNCDNIAVGFHDSPGQHSPTLTKSSHNLYTTSTFQFVAFVWTHESLSDIKPKHIRYTAHEQLGKQISLHIKSYTFEFNSSEAVASLQVFHVHAPNNHHINFTVLMLRENFIPSGHCLFGGLAVFDKFQSRNIEVYTLCTHQTVKSSVYEQPEKYRGIYTQTNASIIVVYSYGFYGAFIVKITVSVTTCIPINMHICVLQKEHWTRRYEHRNSPIFNPFKRIIGKLKSGVSYSLKSKSTSSYFFFAASLKQCIVVQMISDLNKWILRHHGDGTCSIDQLGPKNISVHGRKLHVRLSGVLPFGPLGCKFQNSMKMSSGNHCFADVSVSTPFSSFLPNLKKLIK